MNRHLQHHQPRPAPVAILTEAAQSEIRSLLSLAGANLSAVQETGRPLTLTAPLSTTMQAQIGRAVDLLSAALSTPPTESVIERAIARMSGMARRQSDEVSASLMVSIWVEDLTNTSEIGVIPDEVITATARAFSAGKYGKFFPTSGEFINACKERMLESQRQLWDLKRFQAAEVKPPMPEAERQRQQKRVSELLASFVSPPSREAAE